MKNIKIVMIILMLLSSYSFASENRSKMIYSTNSDIMDYVAYIVKDGEFFISFSPYDRHIYKYENEQMKEVEATEKEVNSLLSIMAPLFNSENRKLIIDDDRYIELIFPEDATKYSFIDTFLQLVEKDKSRMLSTEYICFIDHYIYIDKRNQKIYFAGYIKKNHKEFISTILRMRNFIISK